MSKYILMASPKDRIIEKGRTRWDIIKETDNANGFIEYIFKDRFANVYSIQFENVVFQIGKFEDERTHLADVENKAEIVDKLKVLIKLIQ